MIALKILIAAHSRLSAEKLLLNPPNSAFASSDVSARQSFLGLPCRFSRLEARECTDQQVKAKPWLFPQDSQVGRFAFGAHEIPVLF